MWETEKEVEGKSKEGRYGTDRAGMKARKSGDKKKGGGNAAEVECHLHSSNNMSKMLKVGSHIFLNVPFKDG